MILLLGPPGAGKSVQGGLLGAALGYVSISTGVLLRSKADPELKARMLKGELISSEMVQDLVMLELVSHKPDGALILDGFPRTVDQAQWLVNKTVEEKICIECVLHITVDYEIAKARLLERGRPDDNLEAIEARYSEYKKVAPGIIQTMVADEVPIMTVDGSQSIEIVHKLVMAQMTARALSPWQ
jgi:adenylate kinase